ncbi:MAG: hypothetical protein A2808_03140 [Candidatus Moranbacteria bacterium RIFCSPHIGHO2_01_FULL_55_24]|nr:MAG: hypothetical protein A2808_03140 [Candidatus Moranbacteria bacterium RIFCSPHIGHO2_01_FULL_55_24]
MPFLSETLSPVWSKRYRSLRVLLFIAMFSTVFFLAQKALFPTIPFTFDFKNPGASKNSFLDPRAPDGSSRGNGRLEAEGILIGNAGISGNFSHASISLVPEDKSSDPETLEFSLRRGYRAAWLPEGAPLDGFPKDTLYRIGDRYYSLRDDTLYRFVSEDAFLTRYRKDQALPQDETFLSRYPLSETLLGFRPGLLVSFADGVFIITSETEMRPIGSADIFLALGYRFEDVYPANAEELGIYERGRIFLLGALHPAGTLFQETDSDTFFLIQDGMRHALKDPGYRDFLIAQQTPIRYSQSRLDESVSCRGESVSLLTRSFGCRLPLLSLQDNAGNDYELHIANGSASIDIASLELDFHTDKSTGNMLFLLSQMKQRFLTRFGI